MLGIVQRVLMWIGTVAVVFTLLGLFLIPEATVGYYKASMGASFERAGRILNAVVS